MAHFSLDDVYLTRAERLDRAVSIHPLLATRGPPGTHDLGLLRETLAALRDAGPSSRTPLPAFDKGSDERLAQRHWPVYSGQPEVILLEGWCLGARPQTEADLSAPVNALEAAEDADGRWRGHVNAHLAGDYAVLFESLHAILHLRAPEFSVTPLWRRQQEETRLGRVLEDSENSALLRFVSHFERISRHMLAGGRRADVEVDLDAARVPLRVRVAGRDQD